MGNIPTSGIAAVTMASILVGLPDSVYAHHSRTNFVMNSLVELEGTILEHGYRNPHVYLTLEVVTEAGETQEWLLEANAVSTLSRAGWHAESFAPGDQIRVQGNPTRDGTKRLLFVDVITKADGSSYRSSGLPPGGATTSSDVVTGSTDFSGVWQPDFASRDITAGFRPANLPMTPKGQAILDEFDAADDPALECVPESLPSTILPVFPVGFTWVGEDELHMWYEEFDGRRVIHLGASHSDDIEPSYMGHSIGTIVDGVLVIDTRHFAETVWGLGRGAPSGVQKHLVERYTLSEDGMRLDVDYWFEDPEYLTESVTVTGEMFLKPGYDQQPWDCDSDAATRHMSLD